MKLSKQKPSYQTMLKSSNLVGGSKLAADYVSDCLDNDYIKLAQSLTKTAESISKGKIKINSIHDNPTVQKFYNDYNRFANFLASLINSTLQNGIEVEQADYKPLQDLIRFLSTEFENFNPVAKELFVWGSDLGHSTPFTPHAKVKKTKFGAGAKTQKNLCKYFNEITSATQN